MELLLLLGIGIAAAGIVLLGDDDEELVTAVIPEPTPKFGEEGEDELLTGTEEGEDIYGNEGDADTLDGGGGNDLLLFGTGNTAIGGEGEDRFQLDGRGGAGTVIEDFDPAADSLLIEETHQDVALYQTEDGTGLRLIETQGMTTVLTLNNLSLEDGQTLDVEFYGAHLDDGPYTVAFDAPSDSGPQIIDAQRGTDGDDNLVGTAGDDVIFGEGGADTLTGGEGNDILFSGSGTVHFPESYNHYPGDLTQVGDDGDVLDGGAGDDTLWIGPGTTATGGEGADSFHAFANVYEPGSAAAEITDFNPSEDKLMIGFPVVAGFGSLPSFSFEDAIAGLSIAYDADQDSTLITMDGVAVATLPGDQSGISVAFHDDYSTDEDRWRDASGNTISAADGNAASIILTAHQDQSVLGDNYDATPA